MKIAIIGTGVFALSNAIRLANNKNNYISMWTESNESLELINNNRSNYYPLNGAYIPDSIKVSTNYKEVLENASIVFIMTSIKYLSDVSREISKYISKDTVIVCGSKGLNEDLLFPMEIIKNNISNNNIGLISGPTFAKDLVNNDLVGYSVTGDISVYNKLKEIYAGTNTNLEYIQNSSTIELISSIKNVFAISTGILNGLEVSSSTKSLLITEEIKSISNLIDFNSLISLGGIGDIILTTTSTESRNFTYGTLIGKMMYDEANSYLKNNTVEGYYSLISIYNLFNKNNIKNSIINTIYEIVINKKDPVTLIETLKNDKN